MTHFRILIAAVLVLSSTLLHGPVAAAAPPTCFGRAATIVGTPGDDLLVGRGQAADVIVGLGGDDVIIGYDPADEDVYEGAPRLGDRLCGGAGADFVKGAIGEDRIQGGAGDDEVDGGFGYDVVTRGGGGNDSVRDCDSAYTAGVRTISGGGGDDQLCVDVDAARMSGGGGNDVLVELDCTSNSLLMGGPGEDRLESSEQGSEALSCSEYGPDADRVRGGHGADRARVNLGDVVTEVERVVSE